MADPRADSPAVPELRRRPRRRLLQRQALDVLHWQGRLWVPYGELPRLIGGQGAVTS